jgi:signal transduction histidine kinase
MAGILRRFRKRAARPSGPRREHPSTVETQAGADALLSEIAESVVKGLGFKACMVAVVGTQNGQQVLSLRAFAYESALSKLTWFDAGSRLQGSVLELGQRIAGQQAIGNYVSLDQMENLGVKVIKEDRPFARTDSLYDLFAGRMDRETADKLQGLAHLNMFVTVPFKDAEGNLIGNLFAGTDRLEIKDQEIDSLRAFSSMAAIAIQNAQLLHEGEALLAEVQRRNAQLQALQDTVNALLESTLNERKVLQRIVNSVVEGFGFRAAMLSVVDRDERGELVLPVRAFSIHPSVPGRRVLEEGQRLLGKELIGAYVYVNEEVKKDNLGVRVILDKSDSGRTFELRDLWYPAATPNECAWVQRALGIKALATVPFWLMNRKTGEKDLIGNLYVATHRDEITDDEIDVLRTFALQASNAIRNAELYLDAQRVAEMGSLTSNMVHRLNGIVGKARAWVQQLRAKLRREELDIPFFDERLQRINDGLAEAAAVAEKCRERAQEPGKVSWVDVNATIMSALEGISVPAGIRVEKKLDKRLPPVMAIRQNLVEVFGILISNAIDAMGNDGRLTITSQRTADSIEVSVEDTGKGISDKVKDRLFVLGATTKEHGMGYGLWWARTALSWVEGDVQVKSELGKGSTFTVSLPLEG